MRGARVRARAKAPAGASALRRGPWARARLAVARARERAAAWARRVRLERAWRAVRGRRTGGAVRLLAGDVRGSVLTKGLTVVVIVVVVAVLAVVMASLSDPRATRNVMATVGGSGSTGSGINLLPWLG